MELRIENLGPLKDITFPVRRMNVIIGPNHQGKTWLAYTLYAVAKGFSSSSIVDDQTLSSEAMLGEPGALLQYCHAVHGRMMTALQRRMRSFFQDSSGIVGAGDVQLVVTDEELMQEMRRLVKVDTRGYFVSDDMLVGWTWDELASVYNLALGRMLGWPFALPAERNALILVYKLLMLKRTRLYRDVRRYRSARTVAQQDENDRLYRELGEPRFPEPVEDFLDFLNDLDVEPPSSTLKTLDVEQCVQLADMLEASLLGAHQKLHWEPTGLGGHELMLQVGKDKPLDLHNASSAVKQVAPLFLWLRSGAARGMLIIDEPELNLHPVAQARLLEGLSILVSLGVRVVLTTHSPYILSHLNNLIAAHPTDQALRERQARHLYMQDPRAFLRPDQVGAWQLDQGELRDLYDPEWGIRSDTLSDASEEMQRRYFAIREEESVEREDAKS